MDPGLLHPQALGLDEKRGNCIFVNLRSLWATYLHAPNLNKLMEGIVVAAWN